MTFDELAEEVAKASWVYWSGDQFIPRDEAIERWNNHKKDRSQKYLNCVHEATDALLQLKPLGYRIVNQAGEEIS